ncbi:FTR1 family protein, partial [Thiolapillus sp.]
MKKLFSVVILWTLMVPALFAASPLQRLQQLVDYVGVDYPGAVVDGKVQNPVEYEEMLDFVGTVLSLSKELPESSQREAVAKSAVELQQAVMRKADASQVTAITGKMRKMLLTGFALPVLPGRVPDLERAAGLYASKCASCHGPLGAGDGPAAAGMEPPPVDFTDLERYRQRTLQGLYSTISHGVEGTAMRAYDDLADNDRWALAFYTGQMAPDARPRERGKALLAGNTGELALSKLDLTTLTPAEVGKKLGPDGEAMVAWLRAHPDILFSRHQGAGVAFAADTLSRSLEAYAQGDAKQAHDLAVTAYLEGFEMVENSLDAMDRSLRLKIEEGMTRYRELIKTHAPLSDLESQVRNLQSWLSEAKEKLGSTQLSASTAFASALMILLREGLEAILVIAALAAFLIKTDRREGLRYLYVGTGSAMALGAATWYASTYLVQIGGAGRELTEGFAALFAAAMLFYLGFWLHSKTSAAQWKAFIQGSIKKALGKGTLWGLSGLAFIAVYREIFETVLFYQALWLQTGQAGQSMIVSGLLAASAILVLLAWLILRYSTRLPLRQFFSVTSLFMFVLAIVFAGKGVAALQEAGKLPASLISFPRIDLLGIYPSLQGLGVQLGLVLLAILLLWSSSRRNHDSSGQT